MQSEPEQFVASPGFHEPAASPARQVELFGVGMNRLGLDATVQWLTSNVLANGAPQQRIFTANVDHVVRLKREPEFRQVYGAASMVLADGMPIVWTAKLAGKGAVARIPGIDLMTALCCFAAGKGYSCFLLGSTPQVLQGAKATLQQQFPGLQVVGLHHGYFDESEDSAIIQQIVELKPSLLFVGMGSPRQELWVAKYKDRLACRIVLTVGGAFEVLAGRKRRAPAWMQRIGFEWSWRLFQEPKRLWKRYLVTDVPFLYLALQEVFRRNTK